MEKKLRDEVATMLLLSSWKKKQSNETKRDLSGEQRKNVNQNFFKKKLFLIVCFLNKTRTYYEFDSVTKTRL